MLNRLFLRRLRNPFAVVFHRMRMERARKWLIGKRRSVKDVALSLGYKHPNDFSRAFKKMTGDVPSACRARSGSRATTAGTRRRAEAQNHKPTGARLIPRRDVEQMGAVRVPERPQEPEAHRSVPHA